MSKQNGQRRRSPKKKGELTKAEIKRRSTKYELAQRRKEVERLRLRGLGIAAIAKLMEMSQSAVSNDLEEIRRENAARFKEFDQRQYVADSVSHFETLQQSAWAEYYKAETPQQRLKALDLVRSIENDKIKALRDTGIVQGGDEGPREVTHTHRLDWSREMRENVARALLEQGLSAQLPEPIPEADVIDVPSGKTLNREGIDDAENAAGTDDGEGQE